jgi:hypothetical protein
MPKDVMNCFTVEELKTLPEIPDGEERWLIILSTKKKLFQP